MGTTTDTAIDRLLNQFSDSPNLINLITKILLRMEDSNDMLSDLATKRVLDVATGIWLDQIGDLVGITRPYQEVSDDYIFTYKGIGDPDNINKAYAGIPVTTGGYYQGLNGVFTGDLVDDTTYRLYIYAKIFVTNSRCGIADIYQFVLSLFAVELDIVNDSTRHLNLTIRATFSLTQGERRFILKYAPISAGISVDFTN